MASKKPGGYRALKFFTGLLLILTVLSAALTGLLRGTQAYATSKGSLPGLFGLSYALVENDNLTWLYAPQTFVLVQENASVQTDVGSVIVYQGYDSNRVFGSYSLSSVTGSTMADDSLCWTVRDGRSQPDLTVSPGAVVGTVVFSNHLLGQIFCFWQSDPGLVFCLLLPIGVLLVLFVLLLTLGRKYRSASRPLPGYLAEEEDGGEPIFMELSPFEDEQPAPARPWSSPAKPERYETVYAGEEPTMTIPPFTVSQAGAQPPRRDPLSDTLEFDVQELKDRLLTDRLLRDAEQEDYVKIPDEPRSDETITVSLTQTGLDFDFRHLDFDKVELVPNELGQGFTLTTPDYKAVVRLEITKREEE